MTDKELAEIKAQLEAITPAPWKYGAEGEPSDHGVWSVPCGGGTVAYINFDHQTGDHQPGADATFIAAAPTIVARLLRELERSRKVEGRVEEMFQRLREALGVTYPTAEEINGAVLAAIAERDKLREQLAVGWEVRAVPGAPCCGLPPIMYHAIMDAIEQAVGVCDDHEVKRIPLEARVVDYAGIVVASVQAAEKFVNAGCAGHGDGEQGGAGDHE